MTSDFFVDPETVGQFTGLTDKNGADIYEGDKLEWRLMTGVIVYSFDDGGYSLEIDNGSGAMCGQAYMDNWGLVK